MGRLVLVVMLLAAAVPVFADDVDGYAYAHGRIRYVEPGVTVQRASEGGAEEGFPNLPFLPGDRVFTDDGGRVEFQFQDGSILRVDGRSKLDYVDRDEGRRHDTVLLKLWAGGLYLHTQRDADLFEIETPAGIVETDERGVYRIDVESGETRVSVYEGEATLDSGGRRVRIDAGERSYAWRGEFPEEPRRFDRGDEDDFARWNADRDRGLAWAGDSRRYLPEEVEPYGPELESHGSWYYEAEVGHVWRPYVSAGWRPYCHGRWVWTAYGWTWVANEPWGWAPFHYGRWDWSPGLGWYWVPGAVWSPAWVTWAVGPDYVAWCPLGRRNRPVIVREHRGRAVPRDGGASGTVAESALSQAWVVTRRGDMTGGDVARRRIDTTPAEIKELRVLDSPRLRPTRDFRVADVRTMPKGTGRVIKTKPTIGDTVPELRADPATTIPDPSLRVRRREPERDRQDRDDRRYEDRGRIGDERTPAEQPSRRRPDGIRPTDERGRRSGERPTPRADTPPPRAGDRSEPAPRAREREERPRGDDASREVLRRFFEPVAEPRREGGRDRSRDGAVSPRDASPRDGGSRSQPETGASRREPQRQAPPPSRPAPSSNRARSRDKDKP